MGMAASAVQMSNKILTTAMKTPKTKATRHWVISPSPSFPTSSTSSTDVITHRDLTCPFRLQYLVAIRFPNRILGMNYTLFAFDTTAARNRYYTALMEVLRQHNMFWLVFKGLLAPDHPNKPFVVRRHDKTIDTCRSSSDHILYPATIAVWEKLVGSKVRNLAPSSLLN